MLERGGFLRWIRDGRRAVGRRVAVIASTALIAAVVPTVAMPQLAHAAALPAAPQAHAVTGVGTFTGTKAPIKDGTKNNPYKPTQTKLPAAVSGSAALPTLATKLSAKTTIPGTPVWAQRVSTAAHTDTSMLSGPSGVSAKIAPQSLARELGVSGAVFTVGSTGSAGELRVGLDYSAFAQAYGGNYGSRLELFTLPACALTSPQLAACQVRTPIKGAVNDVESQSLSAVVSLPAATQASNVKSTVSPVSDPTNPPVLAASASAGEEGGSTGQYAASTLSPDGSWTAGGSNGDFTYDYSIADSGSTSTLTPKMDLAYDSGSVDGQTSMTQAQSSWVGDGWSTPDSYIEQTFTSCSDDPEGVAASSATDDECYDGNILTLSLNGSTTEMVKDDTTGTWRLESDNGATITHKTGTSNGSDTYNTDYWVITERDGTSYYFGMNTLPGGKVTNSVDYERVYSAHDPSDTTHTYTDPCYNSTWADSYCTMAYRWHLDYVTDVHGDAMSYDYNQDFNNYAADNGADNGSSSVKYVRDSYLAEIDYGFTTTTGPSGLIPDRIMFNLGNRCALAQQSSCPAVSSSLTPSVAAADYPDVPTDLMCAAGATCTAWSPSFFSTVNLASITTEQYSTSTSGYVDVDSYALAQDFPATGDSSSGTIWLESITHTGGDTTAGGSTAGVPEPPVKFSGIDMPNRLDTTTYSGLYRWRISQVTSELGSVTNVSYEIPDACSTSTNPASNTTSCYPVYWTPQGYAAPIEDWFIKYAVQSVQVSDQTGGAPAEVTSYHYQSPAWHYDDNEVVKAKYQTYGQFRGYQQVTTWTGDGQHDPRTQNITSYYQGMDGDWLSSTSTRSVSLADSQGGEHVDNNALAGSVLESTTYLGEGGPIDDSTITSYWVSAATATRARSGLPALTANMTGTAEVWKRQALTDGGESGKWQETETDTTYDATTSDANFGLATLSYSHTVPVNAAYDRCAMTAYAPVNSSENLVGLVQQQTTVSTACGGFAEGSVSSTPSSLNSLTAPSFTQDQIVSADQSFYDDPSFTGTQASAPTKGDVTETRKATAYTSGTFAWQPESKKTYDSYGRALTSTDADGNTTTTSYTQNSATLTVGQKVTNPLSQSTSETLDPERGLVLTSTDANGVVTTTQYDALGRKTAVWLDSRYNATNPQLANYVYTYTESDTGVSGSVEQTMNEELGQSNTVTILDSLGRTRETQQDTPAGGRLVTDDFYDSRGLVYLKYDAWWDSAKTPTLALTGTTSGSVNTPVPQDLIPNEDYITYDGMGRQVEDQSEQDSTICATCGTTYTVYNGDETTTMPPSGGVVKATQTDPLGRTSVTLEYSVAPTLTVPSNTNTGVFYVSGGTALTVSYGYDGHGNQATTTDADGQVFTSVYDLLGRVTEKEDPTAGDSFMSYDPDGNVVQSEDSRSKYVSYTYDKLGRKTAEYASVDTTAAQTAGPSGTETYAWFYDNSNAAIKGMPYPIGQLTTQITYANDSTYTEQTSGYNIFGESLGEEIIVPASATGLAGTYTITHSYTTMTGLPYQDTYSSFGGINTETVEHSYSGLFDSPTKLADANYGYAQSVGYDAYSRPTLEQIGGSTGTAEITDIYDEHTGSLDEQNISRQAATSTTSGPVDGTAYAYDPSGNITQQTETRLGLSSDTETQCYQYNPLDQLTQAWSATAACSTAPGASNVGNTLGTGSAYWESWTFDSEGNRSGQTQYAIGAATTNTTTNYTYSSTQPNTLTSTSTTGGSTGSTSYSYDTAGNADKRTTPTDGTQTLAWDNAGQLSSVDTTAAGSANTAGTSSYVYDSSGNLLLQTTPTGTTLYFENEQATHSTSNGAVTGIRYLTLPGGGIVARTGNTTDYTFEITDQHGTAELDLDYTCQTPTWRQYDPYGNPRGTTATWVDNRTFLDKVTDPSTGLTDVGARWYDATLGKFISLDPAFESADTLALGGYGYTDGNPVTQEDPSGEMIADPNGGGGSEQALEAQQAAAEKREAADDLARIEQDSDNMSSDSDAADDDLAYSEAFAKLPYGGEGGKALQYLQDSLDLQHQYLASANDARDEIVDWVNTQRALGVAGGGIGSRQASLVSTVTAAWDPKTGKIYVGWSLNRTAKEYGEDFCGEDDCEAQAVADGVKPRTIQFTITIRPRGLQAKAICIACQEDYDPIQAVISGSQPAPGGRWATLDTQALSAVQGGSSVAGEAQGDAEGIADAFGED
jgi:RHS repeat-associated protein